LSNSTSFWSVPIEALFQELKSSVAGLTHQEAQERLAQYGLNRIKTKGRTDSLTLFLNQFNSPIIVILLVAAGLSLLLGDASDAVITIAIVLLSGILGFLQEKGATDAVQKLLAIVQVRSAVLRDGKEQEVPWSRPVVVKSVRCAAGKWRDLRRSCSSRRWL